MSADFEKFLAVAIVLWIATQLVASLLGGLPAFNRKLAETRANTVYLDAVEKGLMNAHIEQQIALVRRVLLPTFMVGLSIIPQGEGNQAVDNAMKLFDSLTDFKPNLPPEPPAMG